MDKVGTDRQARIDALLDKQEITECIIRFSRGIDRHDVELARSAFHEDARDDHGVYIGSGYGVIDWAHEATDDQLRGSQHYVMNILIDLDGDEAHAETYAMLIGQEKGNFGHIFGGGRYLDRLERRDGRWGIVDRVLVIEWGDNYEHLADLVLPAATDRSDPSYQRPLRVTRESRSGYRGKL